MTLPFSLHFSVSLPTHHIKGLCPKVFGLGLLLFLSSLFLGQKLLSLLHNRNNWGALPCPVPRPPSQRLWLHWPAVGRVGGTHSHGPNEMLRWSIIACAHGSSNGVSNQQYQPQDYLLNQKQGDGPYNICCSKYSWWSWRMLSEIWKPLNWVMAFISLTL